MLLNLGVSPELPIRTRYIRRVGVGFLAALLIQLVVLAAKAGGGGSGATLQKSATIAEVALSLLTRYLYAFEITSILILVAVVGAMSLARKSILKESEGDDGHSV